MAKETLLARARSCFVALAMIGSAMNGAAEEAPENVPSQSPSIDQGVVEAPVVPPAIENVPSSGGRPSNSILLNASWSNGLRFASEDERFHMHVGGNAQLDSNWLMGPKSVFAIPSGNANGVENASATLLRRVRLRIDGDTFDQFDYVIEYDFANANNENDGQEPPSFGNISGSPAPANIWMQIREVPWVNNVRLGYQVKPLGMSNNTNQASLPFLERSDNMDAFYGPFDSGYAIGISAQNWTESERIAWRYGIYRPLVNVFGVGLNKTAVGARITGLPMASEDGERLVHFGLGLWGSSLPQDQLRVRARPLLRNAPGYAVPILVDTGNIPGDYQATIGPEFAAVLGPWTFQAEWAAQILANAVPTGLPPQGAVVYHGGYLQALYFLTGERQSYDKHEGVFGAVIPNNNYHLRKGDSYRAYGAWQIGLRCGYLDLTDAAIDGGRLYDWTAGLNWFLNPNMKLQFNYILERRDGPQNVAEGWINGLGFRAAYSF